MSIVNIIIAATLVIFAIVIFTGKGDNLIAGYNTASEQEKELYNVTRLRLLIGTLLLWIAMVFCIGTYMPMSREAALFFRIFAIFIPTIAVVILANTWAKKTKTK
jgi:hypothetical protein